MSMTMRAGRLRRWVAVAAALGILGMAGGRALAFARYVGWAVDSPREVWPLEAKMAHLAWRVQAGEPLYPAWRDYPHVSNFYGPVAFGVVGWAAWARGADLEGLLRTGRLVTLGCGVVAALVVAGVVGRAQGPAAALAAGLAAASAAPLVGFGLMVRPDTMADALGIGGFVLASGGATRWRWLGMGFLAGAILTKQTAGMWLIAAALAVGLEEGGRRGIRLAAGALGIAGLGIAVGTLAEPGMAAALVSEQSTPWNRAQWGELMCAMATEAPDLGIWTLGGIVLWGMGGAAERRWLTLAGVLVPVCLLTALKDGSDRNYFLAWRLLEGLAIGTALGILRRGEHETPARRRAALGVVIVGGLSLLPSLGVMDREAEVAKRAAQARTKPPGIAAAQEFQELVALVERPDRRVLTNSGLLQLHQRARAAFLDPYLFRLQVETGQVVPSQMVAWLEARAYDRVVTTEDLFAPGYATYRLGLPMVLVDPARRHYELEGRRAGMFVYRPRLGPDRNRPR